jgi:hypothetical protein
MGIDHRRLVERATLKLGLLTADDFEALELTALLVDGPHESGVVRRLGRGVAVLTAVPSSAHQRLLAATLQAGEGAVASHRAAAWAWGFDGIRPDGLELSVPRNRNPRVAARVHRMSDLLSADVTTLGPQPITTPARTLIDIAGMVTDRQLEEAFDGARRRGQIHLPFLRWRLSELRRPGRPGVTALDALLQKELTSDRAESWLESAFLRLIRDAGLPPPRVQVVTVPSLGSGRVRLDAFYDREGLVAEVGGHATHSTRRQRQADAERRARLTAMHLRVVDFTYEDVRERPAYVVSTLATLLNLRPAG